MGWFWPKYTFELKKYRGVCLMALEIYVKFEGKLTCASENDTRSLANFHGSTWKSQNWDPDGILFSKVQNVWNKNWHEEYDKFWPEHSKISKICTLMECFRPKYIVFKLKKCRGIMFDSTEGSCKIWQKNYLCFQKWHEEFRKFSTQHVQKSKIGTSIGSFYPN